MVAVACDRAWCGWHMMGPGMCGHSVVIVIGDRPRHPVMPMLRVTTCAIGSKGRVSSAGWVCEEWLLVKTGRGGMGVRTYWCGHLTHVKHE